jgi:hypothetical protein
VTFVNADSKFRARGRVLNFEAVVFDRKAKFEKLLHELRTWICGQMIAFAADVTDRIDGMAADNLFGLNSETPAPYVRLFSAAPPKTSTTRVSQMVLCVGALSFFWHAIDRFSYRPNDEALRAAVLDPVVTSLSKMLVEMLNIQAERLNKPGMQETELLETLQVRSLSYAAGSTVVGKSVDDKDSALWHAALDIAQDVGRPKEFEKLLHTGLLAKVIKIELLNALAATDLKRRIDALEAAL